MSYSVVNRSAQMLICIKMKLEHATIVLITVIYVLMVNLVSTVTGDMKLVLMILLA